MSDSIPHAGVVQFHGEHATLIYERRLRHAPDAVWAAITTPEALTAWFAHRVTIEPWVGGQVEMITGPSAFHSTGRVLAWDPPHVFAYEWRVAPRTELPQGETESVVRWALSPTEDGGTVLHFSQQRLTRATGVGFAPGMHAWLDRLEAHLDGAPLPDWWGRYQAVAAAYPRWGS